MQVDAGSIFALQLFERGFGVGIRCESNRRHRTGASSA